MNTKPLLSLTLLFALVGCDVASRSPEAAAPAPSAQAPAAAAPAAASAATSCPSQDFDAFLAAFMDDVQVQKAHTERPLRSERVDATAMPEPKAVSEMLDGDAIEFPLIANRKTLQAEGLTLNQTEVNGEKQVVVAKPDTDYQLTFFFHKKDCWSLYRMRDDSL